MQRVPTYLLTPIHSKLKIGVTNNVLKRIRALDTASPIKHKLLATVDINCESYLHDVFSEYRLNGEWFNLSVDVVLRHCAAAGFPVTFHELDCVCHRYRDCDMPGDDCERVREVYEYVKERHGNTDIYKLLDHKGDLYVSFYGRWIYKVLMTLHEAW